MRLLSFCIAIIPLTTICLEAQWQDRLYPFRELTDEMVAQIDLKDGSVEDWLEVLGEPTLTGLDFVGNPYDPSPYDCRLWLAWHDATDRLFISAEIVDDFYVELKNRHLDITAIQQYGSTGILLGADGADDSAVESFTWGRIKAGLAK